MHLGVRQIVFVLQKLSGDNAFDNRIAREG